MNSYRSLRRFGLLLVLPLVLSACKSNDAADAGGGIPIPVATSAGVLSSYLVENFDAFAEIARRLVEQDSRYLIQDAPEYTWYADNNGNGSFDAGTDVWLNSSPLRHAGIQFAHATGLTGAGQIIAISDAGFRTSHEVFAGKSVTVGQGVGSDLHGTFVASVASANTANMIGVAPGADLILGSYASEASLAQTAETARTMGAVALNNSWGYVDRPVNNTSYNLVFGGTDGQAYIDALRAYSAEGVVLFAASNDYNNTDAGLMVALPTLVPSMEQGWLAVVNGVPVMVDGDIVSANRVSSACLEAARWCIAADGSWTGATNASNTSYSFGTGTSFSTPVVSGALALLAQAFPDLTPHDLRIRLLASADNSFAGFNADANLELVPGFEHAYSEEWGHGFLDVKAALMPIGDVVIPVANGADIPLNQPLVVEGGASGDAVSRALSSIDLLATDSLSGHFEVASAGLVARRPTAPLFDTQLANVTTSDIAGCCGAVGFFQDTAALPGNIGELDISVVVPVNKVGGKAYGVVAERKFEIPGGSFGVNFGVGNDGGALTPNWYADTQSSLVSAGISFQQAAGRNSEFELEAGIATAFNHSGGPGTSDVVLNTARMTYAMRDALQGGDRLALSLALPTAIVSGSTQITLPTIRANGRVESRALNVGLAPSNREIRIGLDYEFALSTQTKAVFSLQHAENLGNITAARDTGVFVGLKSEF